MIMSVHIGCRPTIQGPQPGREVRLNRQQIGKMQPEQDGRAYCEPTETCVMAPGYGRIE